MAADYSSQPSGFGIKYVTPALIMKSANIDEERQISNIRALDLSFKPEDHHKIQHLEHLDRCKSLQRLVICSQSLSKMAAISKLQNLVELDLSGNRIEQIEGIKPLKSLQKLDLSFNAISCIPPSMSYLAQLTHLNLSRNKLQNIRDVLNLRQCSNLQKLELNHNPMAQRDQYRPFIVFYLSQISMLDSKSISQHELSDSRQRFERNEIDKVLQQLQDRNDEIDALKNKVQTLGDYKRESEGQISELQRCIEHQKESIHSLNTQLATQQEMIRNKNEVISRTRNELSEMEERYHELQRNMSDLERRHKDSEDHKEESETFERLEIEDNRDRGGGRDSYEQSAVDFEHRLPSQLAEACSVYLESIQSVSEMMARYDSLRQQYEATKENMAVITQQISKSNAALSKLRKRSDIRASMDNPFEHEECSKILSETPVVDVEWSVSPILAQKKRLRQHLDDNEEKTDFVQSQYPKAAQITISDDGIRAKIDEAHRLDEEIHSIEQRLRSKRSELNQQQKKRRSMSSASTGGGSHVNNGSMGALTHNMEDMEDTKTQQELVTQFTNLVRSMDEIESGFSVQQKLSHSQEFDDLRIKLVTLYIERYQNEKDNVHQTVSKLDRETKSIEQQLGDYIVNRNNLLLDIHRLLRQYNTDCVDMKQFQFVPDSYTESLPESIHEKYAQIQRQYETVSAELTKEQDVAELLRNQMSSRNVPRGPKGDTMSTGPGYGLEGHSKTVRDLIVRAETAEHRVQELSFVNDKINKQLHEATQVKPQANTQWNTPKKQTVKQMVEDDIQRDYNVISCDMDSDRGVHYELSRAQQKIKSMEQMLKQHESELVETLKQKLKESEDECVRLKQETEDRLSFATYLMNTKEQRLEAEKTINKTLQREIDEMKEQSQLQQSQVQSHIFGDISNVHPNESGLAPGLVQNQHNQQNPYHTPLQQRDRGQRSFTEPVSMKQSVEHNKRLFVSQPLLTEHAEPTQDEHDAVRLNLDSFHDDDVDDDILSVDGGAADSIHSAQQHVLRLSHRLSNLRTKVEAEEEAIKSLETKKVTLKEECTECLEKLKGIQQDITLCKEKKESIVTKLDEMERAKRAEKESKHLMDELMRKSQDYSGRLRKMEQDTSTLLEQKEAAQQRLEAMSHEMESKQRELDAKQQEIEQKEEEYNRIRKRIEIKRFELSNLNSSTFSDPNRRDHGDHGDHDNSTMMVMEERNKENEEQIETQIPTKRGDDVGELKQSTNQSANQELNDMEQRVPAICSELDATLKQLNAIKSELRNHQNYHKIIRLDAVETEIEERVKELSRLKKELNATRTRQRTLDSKLVETAQELKGLEYQIESQQQRLNHKLADIDSIEQAVSKKNMELLALRKKYDKQSKRLLSVNNKLSEGELVLKDLATEQVSVQNKIKKLQKELWSKESELRTSMDVLRTSSTTHDAIKLFKVVEQIETEHKQLNAVQLEIKSARTELEAVQRDLQHQQRQIGELESERKEAENAVLEQQTLRESRDREINQLLETVEDLQRQKRTLNREMENEQNSLDAVRKEMDSQQSELRKLKKEFDETDRNLSERRYKLMSAKHDVTETKEQLAALREEYSKMKAKIRSKSKRSSKSPQKRDRNDRDKMELELYQIYQRDEAEREQKLESYNRQLIEMDKEVNGKKLMLLQYHRDLDDTKNEISEQQRVCKKLKDENARIQRQTQLNEGKLSVYQKEIQSQQQALDVLHEKKRQKTVEMFQEKSSEIQEANQRLQQLQAQITAVSIELDSKKRILDDIHSEKEQNEMTLSEQNEERIKLQRECQDIKQQIAKYQGRFSKKQGEVRSVERQIEELKATMHRIKKDVTKKSDDLLADRGLELQAVQFQLDKAREDVIALNRENVEKREALRELSRECTKKEAGILAKEDKLAQIAEELETQNGELGQIAARIKLKNEELLRVKGMISTVEQQREELMVQSRENIQFDIADIERELIEKERSLKSATRKYQDIQQRIGEEEGKLMVIEETIKQRTEDHQKLEEELREASFQSLQLRSQNESEMSSLRQSMEVNRGQFQSLNKDVQTKQQQRDEVNQKLHEMRQELGAKKRDLESMTLETTKKQSILAKLESDISRLTPQRERLDAIEKEIGERREKLTAIMLKHENGKNELEMLTANISSSSHQHKTIAAEISTLNKLRDDIQQKLKSTQRELQSADQELERVKLDLQLQSDSLFTSKSDRLKVIMVELAAKSRECNENKKKCRSIKELLSVKEKELKQITSNIQHQKSELAQCTAEHHDVQRKLKSKRNELRVTTSELDKKRKMESTLDVNAVSHNDEKYLSELSTAIQVNKQKLVDLDDEVLDKKKNLESVQLEADQYTADLEKLKRESVYFNEQKIAKMEQIQELDTSINAKKQELDKARLEIELKSQQIDSEISLKMKDIMDRIEAKERALQRLTDEMTAKEQHSKAMESSIQQKEEKLISIQAEIARFQATKLEENSKMETSKQSLFTVTNKLMEKQNALKELGQEIEFKLQQIRDLNAQFDEQSEQLRESRQNLNQVEVDLDEKNNELQSIVDRLQSANVHIEDAKQHQIRSGSTSQSETPKVGHSMDIDSMNVSLISNISSPEHARAHTHGQTLMPLDISLEEIQRDALPSSSSTNIGGGGGPNESTMTAAAGSSPQIVIRTVEKLRRTIDAMCYPRGGCIFSLASSIQHFESAMNSLEQKRLKLVSILQAVPSKGQRMNTKGFGGVLQSIDSHFELDSEDEEKEEVLQNTVSPQQQNQAVADLGKIWEELQTVKNVASKLHLERQHLETTLNHAVSIICGPLNSPKSKMGKSPKSKGVFASTSTFASFASSQSEIPRVSKKESILKQEMERRVSSVLAQIDSHGRVWREKADKLAHRLSECERKMKDVRHRSPRSDEVQMKQTLKELERSIGDRKEELESISQQLNAQRVLLKQLREQSDAIAGSVSKGRHFQLSSSPTMARQIANKMRMEKQLADLKQELSEKKRELTSLSRELTDQAAELSVQQNLLFSSIDSAANTDQKVVGKRISEIQRLYKLREKNLKIRIDSYKKELQKRDAELQRVQDALAENGNLGNTQSLKRISKEIMSGLRSLQAERSKMINRRDLRAQIKERDQQIAFLINHFGNESDRENRPNDSNLSVGSRSGSSFTPSQRSHALSQIEQNLTVAMAPFQESKLELDGDDDDDERSSPYRIVPATSSSDNVGRSGSGGKRKRKKQRDEESMLNTIFGDGQPIESQLRYQRETESSRQRRSKTKRNRSKRGGFRSESDDDDF